MKEIMIPNLFQVVTVRCWKLSVRLNLKIGRSYLWTLQGRIGTRSHRIRMMLMMIMMVWFTSKSRHAPCCVLNAVTCQKSHWNFIASCDAAW